MNALVIHSGKTKWLGVQSWQDANNVFWENEGWVVNGHKVQIVRDKYTSLITVFIDDSVELMPMSDVYDYITRNTQ